MLRWISEVSALYYAKLTLYNCAHHTIYRQRWGGNHQPTSGCLRPTTPRLLALSNCCYWLKATCKGILLVSSCRLPLCETQVITLAGTEDFEPRNWGWNPCTWRLWRAPLTSNQTFSRRAFLQGYWEVIFPAVIQIGRFTLWQLKRVYRSGGVGWLRRKTLCNDGTNALTCACQVLSAGSPGYL